MLLSIADSGFWPVEILTFVCVLMLFLGFIPRYGEWSFLVCWKFQNGRIWIKFGIVYFEGTANSTVLILLPLWANRGYWLIEISTMLCLNLMKFGIYLFQGHANANKIVIFPFMDKSELLIGRYFNFPDFDEIFDNYSRISKTRNVDFSKFTVSQSNNMVPIALLL